MPTLAIKPAPLSKRAVVVFSFPLTCSWDLLNSLVGACYLSGQDDHPHATTTVLLYTLYKYLEYKLAGTALDAVRGKFAELSVDSQKGQAIITVRTEPTFSAVRKVVTLVARGFTPAKLFPLYKKYVQLLGMKPDQDQFAHAVAQMVAGSKTLATFVTGTVRVPDGGDKVLREILGSIKPEDTGSKGKAPATGRQSVAVQWDELAAGSRLEAWLAQQLLRGMQIESHVRDGNLIPITGGTKWATVSGKIDAERIKRFVDQKLVKLGDKLPGTILLMCAGSGYFTAAELERLPASYTAASLTESLKKVF